MTDGLNLGARRSASPASVPRASMLLSRGLRLAEPYFLIPFCNSSGASSTGSRRKVTGSRQNTTHVHPSLPSICTASPGSGACVTTLPSQQVFTVATSANPFVAAKLHRNATHTCTNGGPSCSRALGLVLDGARCFMMEPTCLRYGLRAGEKIGFEDGGGHFPQLCRVQRLSCQHLDHSPKNISIDASLCHSPSHRPPALGDLFFFRSALRFFFLHETFPVLRLQGRLQQPPAQGSKAGW